jgi:hypothetical protein
MFLAKEEREVGEAPGKGKSQIHLGNGGSTLKE